MNNLVGDVMANPRDFYQYINSQKKDTQGIPPLKRKNGKGVAQSDLEKAEEFNSQFTDVFSKNEHTQVPLRDRAVLQNGLNRAYCSVSARLKCQL